MLRWRVALIATAMGLGLFVEGCAAPRICRGITSRGDEVKFLYYEGGDTGVVKCKMAADGALADCHPMTVELEP
jgi:hypothetical protein